MVNPSALYEDIQERTNGEIYIGVVGPVRSGKSTFIKRFMDTLVVPAISDEYSKERTVDSLPQSSGGRTVMTTEPKFVPESAQEITLGENTTLKIKMIDCVGYLIPGAMGINEDGVERMVSTPWSSEEMPFEKAAEIGTKKVIAEHSTIGILVTSDGTVGDIERSAYIDAENRVARELKEQNKPFIIILNSSHPQSEESQKLALELEETHGVPVALVSCLELDKEDIDKILELVLYEFPLREIRVSMPSWVDALPDDHLLKKKVWEGTFERAGLVSKTGDVLQVFSDVSEQEFGTSLDVSGTNPASGSAFINVNVPRSLFYKILGDQTGFDIPDDAQLIRIMTSLSEAKHKYDKFANALSQVEDTGYGIVMPSIEDMTLEDPEIVKQAGSYGVKLRASAPSIHMIKANIKAEVNPIVGSEKQSEDMVKFLLKEFEEDPTKIWESNMFGKTLYELVGEGLNSKLSHMPYEAQMKLADTLQKIINDGSNGLICILL